MENDKKEAIGFLHSATQFPGIIFDNLICCHATDAKKMKKLQSFDQLIVRFMSSLFKLNFKIADHQGISSQSPMQIGNWCTFVIEIFSELQL